MSYHTGLDAHKNFSTFQHMDQEGAYGLSMHVPTDKEGISKFLDQLNEPTTITFEAGRNYWWLHEFFTNHPMISQVNVVDPRRSRNIAKELSVISGYGRAKNDDIDAEMLADQSRRGLAPTINVPTAEQLEMRTINRHRLISVTDRTRVKNGIHALLAMHGASARLDDLLKDSNIKAKIMEPLPNYIPFIVDQLLDRIRLYDLQIGRCDVELGHLLPESHPQIKILISHPGIGPVFSRTIYTEILDIGYFKEPRYLISYSGLAPIENESAGHKGPIKLNRHCNYYLKYAFVESAHNVRKHVNYRRKYELDVKKHGKIVAKLNLARRIAKAVYWMLIRQQPYKK